MAFSSKHFHRHFGHPTPVGNSVLSLAAGTDSDNSTSMIHSSLHGVLKWIPLHKLEDLPRTLFTADGFKVFHPVLLLFILGGT